LPFAQPVKVVPVSEDDGRGDAIEARALNVSTGGMSVLMPRRPASAQVCVEVALPSRREPATIIARVLRAKPPKDGRVEAALAFAWGWGPTLNGRFAATGRFRGSPLRGGREGKTRPPTPPSDP